MWFGLFQRKRPADNNHSDDSARSCRRISLSTFTNRTILAGTYRQCQLQTTRIYMSNLPERLHSSALFKGEYSRDFRIYSWFEISSWHLLIFSVRCTWNSMREIPKENHGLNAIIAALFWGIPNYWVNIRSSTWVAGTFNASNANLWATRITN